tara:strand:+ start:49009 stop:49545 length:537 start_codon:yes stop_codon:yes gene_type:complete
MLPLGTLAPKFKLIDATSDTFYALDDLTGKNGTLIMFICNHCPYVIHVNPMITTLALAYQKKGIKFIAISSNDVINYPQDAPHLMKEVAAREKYTFPYLYDQTQEVAKAYDAACTPDFYLFDKELKLVYRGQLDSSRPSNKIPLTGTDVINAFDNLLNNKPIRKIQKPSMGCNIKWFN